jgi:hypothetical protein
MFFNLVLTGVKLPKYHSFCFFNVYNKLDSAFFFCLGGVVILFYFIFYNFENPTEEDVGVEITFLFFFFFFPSIFLAFKWFG